MAGHWHEGFGQTIGFNFVIARDHPNLAPSFHPDLRRSGHVPCGVEADRHIPMRRALAIGNAIGSDLTKAVAITGNA